MRFYSIVCPVDIRVHPIQTANDPMLFKQLLNILNISKKEEKLTNEKSHEGLCLEIR